MSSRKPSANAKRVSAFKSSLGDEDAAGFDHLFSREEDRNDRLAAEREEALYEKSCSSKNRYASRADALEAIALCADHGRRGLRCYKCSYCGGWHLTSKPENGRR